MQTKWIVWIIVLSVINIIGGFYFTDTPEGKMAILFMFLSFAFMSILYARFGFTKILGLSHILWLYLVPHCLILYLSLKPSHFKGWLFMVFFLNGISLIIDIINVAKYLNGDRSSLIENKNEKEA